jgi:hypothetical protein
MLPSGIFPPLSLLPLGKKGKWAGAFVGQHGYDKESIFAPLSNSSLTSPPLSHIIGLNTLHTLSDGAIIWQRLPDMMTMVSQF